ncbi:Response regulator protein VraR [Corynebacterium kalinowskii]|uniref:Response regulator protein VraR n=1 Tax=Corynebacterium kalinowskii TaxID=2675216 RepID=A0A6B8VQX5_9CORY|nr:response regulator transcription factor [Corynebacterium kalinowskii]QGU01425.1 Response regulator protein VraR [Corynebacterium kalinowskii]
MIRVAIADDDALVRAGIAQLLAHYGDIEVLIEAADGAQLVTAVRASSVDVILLDIRMPRLDGLATLAELRRIGVVAPVAMLTTFRQESLIEAAIAQGAQGFLLKSDSPEDLARQVRGLAAGGAVFSPRVANWLIGSGAVQRIQAKKQARDRMAELTARQREVLAELATGASNHEIADRLHLSEGTVKQYLGTIFGLLGVENRVQAALIGYQAQLP